MWNYRIIKNKDDYVFSAITASIDGKVKFEPIENNKQKFSTNGQLRINMNARFIINDGQHRRAAIEQAIKVEPDLGNESIAVVFFIDRGLERSQQMFSDLNRHAVKPSRSLGLLYEHRNDMAKVSKLIASDLKKENIFFAGIDFIDQKLNGDINITSPTGLKTLYDLTKINLAETFWKKLKA